MNALWLFLKSHPVVDVVIVTWIGMLLFEAWCQFVSFLDRMEYEEMDQDRKRRLAHIDEQIRQYHESKAARRTARPGGS